MSFNYFARKVRNPNLHIGVRRSALYSCLLRLSWLTGQPHSEIIARIDAKYPFRDKRSTPEHYLAAIAAVEVERNLALEKLRAFEHRRIRGKLRGKRTLSKAEQKYLGNLG